MLLQLAGRAEKLKVALLEDGHRPVEVCVYQANLKCLVMQRVQPLSHSTYPMGSPMLLRA